MKNEFWKHSYIGFEKSNHRICYVAYWLCNAEYDIIVSARSILLESYDQIFINFLLLTDLDTVFNRLYWSLYVKLYIYSWSAEKNKTFSTNVCPSVRPFVRAQKKITPNRSRSHEDLRSWSRMNVLLAIS